ncbi:Flp family type IVb pilin [Rhizobium cauense]|uniref:Flp family type IVb pilin n=1 Tax=Rhizobium cauense TaxID=1166683 RepID=UPI001C6EAAC8|nr:Flp family type IVb pilin [Rhizobium cauense]MBW9114541.1 Flp family type IVb pilin [Rhizobium cauense]
MRVVRAFLADIRGATAVEYGLIAAVISVAILAALQALGGNITTLFTGLANQFPN